MRTHETTDDTVEHGPVNRVNREFETKEKVNTHRVRHLLCFVHSLSVIFKSLYLRRERPELRRFGRVGKGNNEGIVEVK